MLNDLIQRHEVVRIYGKVVFELPDEAELDLSSIRGLPKGNPCFVAVVGVEHSGDCTKYEDPFFVILPSRGENPKNIEWEKKNIKEWEVGKNSTLITLFPEVGEANEISGDVLLKGYPKVDGFLHVRDININDGKLSFSIEAGANVKYHKWDKWHRYSMDHLFKVEINHCIDWDFGIASLKVCVYQDRICGEVSIIGINVASHCEYF